MTKLIKLSVYIYLILLSAGVQFAQNNSTPPMQTRPQSPYVNQSIEKPDTLYLGTRFFLRLKSDRDLYNIINPDSLAFFKILKVERIREKNKSTGLKLTIVPLDTGELTFPALKVQPFNPKEMLLSTTAFTVKVSEVRAPNDTLLVDIAETQKYKWELPYWVYFLLIGLVILLFIILMFTILKRKKKRVKQKTKELVQPKVDTRTPEEIALDALKSLDSEELPTKGEFLLYHYRISEIMKLYLENSLNFSANEMTTREIKNWLKQNSKLYYHDIREVSNFLDNCDKVKFAKYVPSLEECQSLMHWAMNWALTKRQQRQTEISNIEHKKPIKADQPSSKNDEGINNA